MLIEVIFWELFSERFSLLNDKVCKQFKKWCKLDLEKSKGSQLWTHRESIVKRRALKMIQARRNEKNSGGLLILKYFRPPWLAVEENF